jgi:hypothetical protein
MGIWTDATVALGVLLFLVRGTNMFNAMKHVGHSFEPG